MQEVRWRRSFREKGTVYVSNTAKRGRKMRPEKRPRGREPSLVTLESMAMGTDACLERAAENRGHEEGIMRLDDHSKTCKE